MYAAQIEGSYGELYVRIGGSDNEWQPSHSRIISNTLKGFAGKYG